MTRTILKPTSLLFILTVLAASIVANRTIQSSEKAMSVEGPKIIAVKFHADWCGYCKTMGPVFEELEAKFDQEPVLYVTFDQTREHNRKQSQYLEHVMGLDHVWSEHACTTGFILLIDGKTKQIVDKLTHDQDLKTMGATLQEAVKKVS